MEEKAHGMSDEAVYKTAPATPGLLIIYLSNSTNDNYFFCSSLFTSTERQAIASVSM